MIKNTERPLTVGEGSNTISGKDAEKMPSIFNDVKRIGEKCARIPEYWDGHVSNRIANVTATEFGIAFQ